jgi:hypothetical protein
MELVYCQRRKWGAPRGIFRGGSFGGYTYVHLLLLGDGKARHCNPK